MPKVLQNEICRADTKKNGGSSLAASKKQLFAKVSKVLTDKFAKKKSATAASAKTKSTKTVTKNEKKLITNRKKGAAASAIQRRGVGSKDSNAAENKTIAPKMKTKMLSTDAKGRTKDEKVGKGKTKESTPSKKTTGSANAVPSVAKKDAKKTKTDVVVVKTNPVEKNDSSKNEIRLSNSETHSSSPLRKEAKKRKEQSDMDNKETKKCSKATKKIDEESKKESQKPAATMCGVEDGLKNECKGPKSDDILKLFNEGKKLDERCMAPKKRIKHKCAKESMTNNIDAEKEANYDEKGALDLTVESTIEKKSSMKNVKFFKSKSKKLDKTKEVASLALSKSNDSYSKEAFAVYDNIDDDSEGPSKNVVRNKGMAISSKAKATKTKTSNETKKGKTKSKTKSGPKKTDKRKLESDSEVEINIKCKKLKRNVIEDDSDEESGAVIESVEEESKPLTKPAKTVKATKKSPAKGKDLKRTDLEGDSCSSSASSSDNAPLNTLIGCRKNVTSRASSSENLKGTNKNVSLKLKQEPLSEESETDAKNKIIKSKSSPKKDKVVNEVAAEKSPKNTSKMKKDNSKPSTSDSKALAVKTSSKKSVRFSKSATSKTSSKPVRKRRQRMASLNALAMVHCMYENEGKSVSVSSFESTENSDDNAEKKAESSKKIKEEEKMKNETEIKSELNNDVMALVKFEARLQDVDPVINRESLRSAPGLRSVGKHWDMNATSISSTVSDDNEAILVTNPIVVKEIATAEKPKTVLKKKFARALRRHISEDSSEEDKHQALLLEEKQRMIRRRRRQRKELTMDLKDMVVCKRMASLNATAILAASYSSTTGKRTITVKSSEKSDEKQENVQNFENTERMMTKVKDRKHPFTRKKFSSSSDADVEDEADMSGNEVVVKTASSSGKQQVSLIVNQDSGVTITGLYLNSTTKSTHHQGYCSISGMQYRISSTSHTQTEATTVTTEAIVRTPQEPLRPPINVSLHPDRQSSPSSRNAASSSTHPSPVKTYTPLGALSNMQPPGSPHHLHHLHHHPKTVTISSTQEISSLERHGCPSAFTAPTVYGPPPPPPLTGIPSRPPYPILSKTPPEPGYVAGYYQPAGPLISHHHHHHHHHHHVQSNTTTTTSTAGIPSSTATSASPSASTISFTKVSQSPLVQPPTPPASNVTQPVSENSDNEMASATTPAAEITVPESAAEEPNYPMNYRFSSSGNQSFRSPSHNYQSYYPSPPSTANLSHPQPQAHFQEILYSTNPPSGPPGPYHLGYLQSKGPPYHPALQRRYIPALPPQQYFHHEYSSPAPASQQQVIVPAHPLAATSDSYHSAPSTPSIIESYPPPPPLYYSGYSSAPPTPYYPYATSSRSLTLVETSCPCPLQGCQKNVDTGPLTGFISKGPVEQRSTPLSPVALTLPQEPHDIRSLPSPARGSAGSRPTPSPAIATAKNPSSWNETGSDCGYDTFGLLTISKSSVTTTGDSAIDLDSGIDGTSDIIVDAKTKSKYERREGKKTKVRRIRTSASKRRVKDRCSSDESVAKMRLQLYEHAIDAETDSVALLRTSSMTTAAASVSRLKSTAVDLGKDEESDENIDDNFRDLPSISRQSSESWCRDEDSSDLDMPPKLYPQVGIEYENCYRSSDTDDEDTSQPPPVKKMRQEFRDDRPVKTPLDSSVDVEKNNYLSALQLRSVSDFEHKSDDSRLPNRVVTSTSIHSIAESLAPLSRHDEKGTKLPTKTKNEPCRDLSSTKEIRGEVMNADSAANERRRNEYETSSSSVLCRKGHVETKKPKFRKRRWTMKKKSKKKKSKLTKSSEEEKLEAENAEKRRRAELLLLTQKRAENRLKWSNGWMWMGEPYVAKVFLNTEGPEVLRTCYHAMKHRSGDVIKPKDCILLRSGSKKTDLPYVAKVAHLWEDPDDGEMMMSLFWYYRPEHTEHDAVNCESPYELYASKHKDVNSVACIEDKCYVLTFNEYCRYHKSLRQNEESVDISSVIVPPLAKKRYPRQALLPPENTSLDLVFFCRKIYDFRQHRLLKNPFFV